MKTILHFFDFLGMTFDLSNGTYKPYKKPNDQLLHIKSSTSDWKPATNIYKGYSSNNSSNKQVFGMSKGEYEKAFIESDYINVSLIYTDKKEKKSSVA